MICDEQLNISEIVCMECKAFDAFLSVNGKEYKFSISPNEFLTLENGALARIKKIPCALK